MQVPGGHLILTTPVFFAAMTLIIATVFILFYGGRGALPLILSAVMLVTACWLFGYGMMYRASTQADMWFGANLGDVGVILIPPVVYLFTVKFLDIMPQRVWLVLISWAGAVLFIVLQWQLHFIHDGFYQYWFGPYPQYNWQGIIYLIFHMFFLTLNLVEYIIFLTGTRDKDYFYYRARRLFYVFLLAILAGVDFLPGWGVPVYPFGFVVIFVAVIMLVDTVLRLSISGLTPDVAANQIVEIMPDPLLVCDKDHKIHVANKAATDQLSLDGKLFQADFTALLSHKSKKRFIQLISNNKITDEVMKLRTDQGYASFSISKVDIYDPNTGQAIGYVLVAHNIEAYKKLQNRLETIASLPLNDPSPVYQVSAKGEVIFANEVAQQWLKNWNDQFPQSIKNLIDKTLKDNEVQQAETEQQDFACLFTAKKLQHRERVNLYGFDITARKRWERIVAQVAREDTLTHLPNRRALEEILGKELAHCKRTDRPLALLMFDLDYFKKINDNLGHPVGDKLLYEVGQRINSTLLKADTLSRIGGDEFVALIKPVQKEKVAEQLEQTAQRILSAFTDASFAIDEEKMNITTSVGIALYPEHGQSKEQLMENVDSALRQAKHEGKNTYRFYKPSDSHDEG